MSVQIEINKNLFINASDFKVDISKPLVLDNESNEPKENEQRRFVGIALSQTEDRIDYFTELTPRVKEALESCQLIGHSLKGDMRWLMEWGVKVKQEQLHYDTILASYVKNSTKASHGLKTLAKEILGLEWHSYTEMVHPDPEHPKKKVTLDKQPVERVAEYCGMDCLATLKLYEHFQKTLSPTETQILEEIELPTARVLLKMEMEGVRLDLKYLQELKNKLTAEIEIITAQLTRLGIENPNSNAQVAAYLEVHGAILPLTKKGNKQVNKATLYTLKGIAGVELLLRYSEIEKLLSTYVNPYLETGQERVHAQFNQITKDEKGEETGIHTSRLSSSNPNLQNIPVRTESGLLIRTAFIPEEGSTFLEADYSQIEPRLIAHFSGDPFLVNCFNNDIDPYKILSEESGRDRQDCKTFFLALCYGAYAPKLAKIFNCEVLEAERIIRLLSNRMPGVVSLRNRTIYQARKDKGVFTLHGRYLHVDKLDSKSPWERSNAERLAMNYKIQGSAAEIMKKGLIQLEEADFNLKLTVHDSFLVNVGETLILAENEINEILCNVVKLSVPLKVKITSGNNWKSCHA